MGNWTEMCAPTPKTLQRAEGAQLLPLASSSQKHGAIPRFILQYYTRQVNSCWASAILVGNTPKPGDCEWLSLSGRMCWVNGIGGDDSRHRNGVGGCLRVRRQHRNMPSMAAVDDMTQEQLYLFHPLIKSGPGLKYLGTEALLGQGWLKRWFSSFQLLQLWFLLLPGIFPTTFLEVASTMREKFLQPLLRTAARQHQPPPVSRKTLHFSTHRFPSTSGCTPGPPDSLSQSSGLVKWLKKDACHSCSESKFIRYMLETA